MARIDAKEADILRLILERLRTQLSLTESQCYETTEPLAAPAIPSGGEYFLSVSPHGSTFDEELAIGGQTTEDIPFVVTIYSKIKLDRADHDEELMRNVTRGLMPIKRLVLKALQLHDIQDDSGDTMLRQFITATSADPPKYDDEKKIGWCGVTFKVSFEWDLT